MKLEEKIEIYLDEKKRPSRKERTEKVKKPQNHQKHLSS